MLLGALGVPFIREATEASEAPQVGDNGTSTGSLELPRIRGVRWSVAHRGHWFLAGQGIGSYPNGGCGGRLVAVVGDGKQ